MHKGVLQICFKMILDTYAWHHVQEIDHSRSVSSVTFWVHWDVYIAPPNGLNQKLKLVKLEIFTYISSCGIINDSLGLWNSSSLLSR